MRDHEAEELANRLLKRHQYDKDVEIDNEIDHEVMIYAFIKLAEY